MIVFVLKGYPRLSETFIAQEIAALEKRGVPINIFALRHPTDREYHPIHDEISATTTYLPEALFQEPRRVLRAWLNQRKLAKYRVAKLVWLRDLQLRGFRESIQRFLQAIVLVDELKEECRHLHAHFLHSPATVTRYAAILSGLPWSCSAHAKDIWTTPTWEKIEKLREMAWLVTCTEAGRRHLATLAPEEGRVELVYHGLDLNRFNLIDRSHTQNNGRNQLDPLVLLSVGRAVPKKGYDILLSALSLLPKYLNWQFEHFGAGTSLIALQRQAKGMGLDDRIIWHGPKNQKVILAAYRKADLFILASRIDENGDRDGLPNVLLEAQSQGLPCVSTTISGIPELIVHDETGFLVSPEDIPALAKAIEELIINPSLRFRYGQSGCARVKDLFSHDVGADRIAKKFGFGKGLAL